MAIRKRSTYWRRGRTTLGILVRWARRDWSKSPRRRVSRVTDDGRDRPIHSRVPKPRLAETMRERTST